MEQQRNNPNEEFNTNKSRAGEGAFDNDEGKEQLPESGKNKNVQANTNSHDEGQYQEGIDKPTMNQGSSEAEVNPSAKNPIKGNK